MKLLGTTLLSTACVVSCFAEETCQTPIPFTCNSKAFNFDGKVVDISCGGGACVARKKDDTVVAWGSPLSGGDDSGIDLTNVVDVSCGSGACVALKSDGTAVAWGDGTEGGDVSSVDLTNIADISISWSSQVLAARKNDGTAIAWPRKAYFRLLVTTTNNGDALSHQTKCNQNESAFSKPVARTVVRRTHVLQVCIRTYVCIDVHVCSKLHHQCNSVSP